MTLEELQNQVSSLQNELSQLKDVYYRTHFIDKDIFQNPVYFLGKVNIPKIAGAPTSTPEKGTLIYDTTNNKLYVYNSAWKSVTLT